MTTIHCPACGEDFDYDGDLYLSPDDFRGIEIECPECGTKWKVKIEFEEHSDR